MTRLAACAPAAVYPVLVSAVVLVLAGCGGGGAASPSTVATAAGATACDNSGFYVENKISKDKSTIYDCRFAHGLPKCVTYSGNIASDATEEVQLLFSNAINAQKPTCLGWVALAKARLARIAAQKAAAKQAARASAYLAALARSAKEPWHAGYSAYAGDITGYQLPNIYWKWLSGVSCAQYAMNGCWQIEVITRNGCPTGVSVEFSEVQDGTQVGTLYASSGALPPQTPAQIEIDADNGNAAAIQGRISSLTCD